MFGLKESIILLCTKEMLIPFIMHMHFQFKIIVGQ